MADAENTIIMETTKGTVKIDLRPDLAPGHCDRIKELAREGFYDGIIFHRVIDGFMAQVGCPNGTGMGGSDKPNLQVVQSGTACSRHLFHGPDQSAEFREFAIFHLFRKCRLPRQSVHGLGSGQRRHGRG